MSSGALAKTARPAAGAGRWWVVPQKLVERVRWIFLLVAVLGMTTTIPGMVMSRSVWLAPGLAASIALPVLWIRGYRRGFARWDDAVEGGGLLLVGLACREASWALNLVYVMLMFLALFGSSIQATSRTLLYVAVMEALVVVHPVADPMMKPGMLAVWLLPSLAFTTLSMRALAVVLNRHEMSATRHQILVEAGASLLRARNFSAVQELAVEVVGRLMPHAERSRCWLVSGPEGDPRVLASWPAGTDMPLPAQAPFRLELPLNESLNGNTRVVIDYRMALADEVRDSLDLAIGQISLALEGALLQEELAHRATHDVLTSLPNRRAFIEHLHQAWPDSELSPGLAVLFVDLDDFKTVNDGMGHEAGDELLSAVAARLARTRRPGDIVARLGGDEFAVLMYDLLDEAQASAVAGRIIAALETPFSISGRAVHARSSVGVATSDGAADPAELVRNADVAMYVAKALGKGRYQLFSSAMHDAVKGELRSREEFEQALEHHQLVLYYQPIMDLDTGRVSGFEALLRWQHPERGLLLPGEFISAAERLGVIVDLERWVLIEATGRAAKWPAGPDGVEPRISINLCSHHVQHPDVVEHVLDALSESGLDPHRLVIEVTEEVLLQDRESGIRHLNALKNAGVGLALDDFGTGYSSLSYLDQLPVDTIKIDRSFVNDTRWAFVTAILDMTRALQIDTVAEGVESTEQASWLREAGCSLAQGFHYARPMPADDVPSWLVNTQSQSLVPQPR